MKKVLEEYINDAHGDGYDTVEIPIETARAILAKFEIAEKALDSAASHIAAMAGKFEPINNTMAKLDHIGLAEEMINAQKVLLEALKAIRES